LDSSQQSVVEAQLRNQQSAVFHAVDHAVFIAKAP
jgi:hypothetical protein